MRKPIFCHVIMYLIAEGKEVYGGVEAFQRGKINSIRNKLGLGMVRGK